MSKALGKRCVWGLCGVLASALIVSSAAQAEVSTDLSGTILVYPKVIYDGERDTVIQLANTSNSTVHAWCFYINGAQNCQVTDFMIWLTKQQPTHWVASQGRPVNPLDGFNNDGSGLDPGSIPPVPVGFEGELKCIQVDTGGTPLAGNALKGDAVLRDLSGDVSRYNAVAILASGQVSDNNEILLNNTPDSNDGEANSCHAEIFVNHFAAGVSDPVIEEFNPDACIGEGDMSGCPVQTELTIVPCSEDLENLIFPRVTMQYTITNEFENTFSFSTTVQCWANQNLATLGSVSGRSPFSFAVLGSTAAFTSVWPVDDDGGVIAVAEEIHMNLSDSNSPIAARAAWDLQAEGDQDVFANTGRFLPRTRYDAASQETGTPVIDKIVIPEGF